jgi:hypothetical protein
MSRITQNTYQWNGFAGRLFGPLAFGALIVAGCARSEVDQGNVSGGKTGSSSGGKGDAPLVDVEPDDPVFVPQRIRKLSNFEFERSVASLLNVDDHPARAFAPDLRQRDFTANASQRVDPTYVAQLEAAARTLAEKTKDKLAQSCAAADRGCAESFIKSWAGAAYRRPLVADEIKDLLAVYDVGAADGGYKSGIELVITATLQSASFLYLVEVGEGDAKNGSVQMSSSELAAAISYLVTGGPPDQELKKAAESNALSDGNERRKHAERLFATMESRGQMQRLLKEWLQLDRLEEMGKDNKTYPRFDELRPQMVKETEAFINEVLYSDDASLKKLLSADYTVAESGLTSFYGATMASPRVSLASTRRRGILNQASFLAVHGKDSESSPVKRGVAILKKIMCIEFPTPAELNIKVVPPDPDPNATTRQRFAKHGEDPKCSACHSQIDAVGFTFEGFDGMGGARTKENDKPIDTSAKVEAGSINGMMADSAELVDKIAGSTDAAGCFALNFFRFASAQSGEGTEKKFEEFYKSLDEPTRGNIKNLLFSFVQSDVFARRRVR